MCIRGTKGAYVRDSPPGRLVPLRVLVNIANRTEAEETDIANLARTYGLHGCPVARLRLVVLRNAPDEALRLIRLLVLSDEVDTGLDIRCDGFLGQHVLACG